MTDALLQQDEGRHGAVRSESVGKLMCEIAREAVDAWVLRSEWNEQLPRVVALAASKMPRAGHPSRDKFAADMRMALAEGPAQAAAQPGYDPAPSAASGADARFAGTGVAEGSAGARPRGDGRGELEP